VKEAVQSMARLNRGVAEGLQEFGVRGCTDVTGFGFLVHASEMVRASGCGIRVVADAVPLLPGAIDYAERGFLAGGLGRNRAFLKGLVEGGTMGLTIAVTVPTAMADVLFDSETSGGLLFSVAPEHAPEVAKRFAGRGESVWEIGEVIPEVAIHVN